MAATTRNTPGRGLGRQRQRIDLSTPPRSINETMATLGISRATLYRIMDRGEIRWVQIGKQRKFTDDEIRAYLQRQAS